MKFPQTTPRQQGKIILWGLGLTLLGSVLHLGGMHALFAIGCFILSGGLLLSLGTIVNAIGDNKWYPPWRSDHWDKRSLEIEIKVKQRVEAQIQSQILNRIETKTKNYEFPSNNS